MDKRILYGLPVLGLVIWYVWTHQGRTHGVTVDARAVGPEYAPFAHWITMRPGGYVHVFPDRVGPACLVAPLQNEPGGALSTGVTAYDAEGYASA